MVMKPDGILCYNYVFVIFFEPRTVHNVQQHSYHFELRVTSRDVVLIYSVTICDEKQRIVHGHQLMFAGFHYQSPLLTMFESKA